MPKCWEVGKNSEKWVLGYLQKGTLPKLLCIISFSEKMGIPGQGNLWQCVDAKQQSNIKEIYCEVNS